MRCCAALAFLAMLAVVPFGVGSPINGSYGDRNEIDAEPWRSTRTFHGGERACVLACGNRGNDGEIISHLHIKILDAAGNVVAEDNGAKGTAGDFVGVLWYPPRTAEYRIEIHNVDRRRNKVYIAIK